MLTLWSTDDNAQVAADWYASYGLLMAGQHSKRYKGVWKIEQFNIRQSFYYPMKYLPSILESGPVTLFSFPDHFHSNTVVSCDPEPIRPSPLLPWRPSSGEKLTQVTIPLCPNTLWIMSPREQWYRWMPWFWLKFQAEILILSFDGLVQSLLKPSK